MQPGNKSRQIERARNTIDLGALGDPERWGGTCNVSLIVPTQTEVWSPQILRVQCADLIARAWQLLIHWHLDGVQDTDQIVRCGFELTVGVGQSHTRVVLDLTSSVNGYGPYVGNMPNTAWESQLAANGGYLDGTVLLSWPLPAVALAGRFVLGVARVAPPPMPPAQPMPMGPIPVLTHTITGSCFASVSPVSLL